MLRKTRATLLLRATPVFLFEYYQMEKHYFQEAYESLQRFQNAPTYPGSVRAATPGDTKCYSGRIENLDYASHRQYWRPVTDDPQPQHLIPIRIRFKDRIFTFGQWENRLNIITVNLPASATIQDVKEAVVQDNASSEIAQGPFTLALQGRELDVDKPLSEFFQGHELHNTEASGDVTLDAVDASDHLMASEDMRPKDWHVDEITPHEAEQWPYKELLASGKHTAQPRYPYAPRGIRNYGKTLR